MADASNGSEVNELDLHETRKRLEVLDKNYRNLKGLSQKAVVEFEDLQKKCQEYFEKYKEQEAKYLKVKGDLEKLKDVSNLALSEYENLHSKFEVEQSCRNKAEEFATNMVQQNKQLKRQSQLLISQVGGQVNLVSIFICLLAGSLIQLNATLQTLTPLKARHLSITDT
ncbi:shootin-1-like [Oculina patagonica]